jgi:hypothetical protein
MCKIRMTDAQISGKQIIIMRIVTMMGGVAGLGV